MPGFYYNTYALLRMAELPQKTAGAETADCVSLYRHFTWKSYAAALKSDRRTHHGKNHEFTINHLDLLPGIYVSRKDKAGDSMITTFDIRMTRPNFEPVMNTAEIHTIEHLAATFLRNHGGIKDRVIYFGPMGCRTGFYLLLAGDYQSRDIVPLMKEMFVFIRDFEGDVPGASARDCGNYLDMNLPMAKWLADRFLREVMDNMDDSRLIYPNSQE